MNDFGFSVNTYDSDGDVVEEGIYFHFGGTRVLVAEGIDELKRLINKIQLSLPEIEDNCKSVGL